MKLRSVSDGVLSIASALVRFLDLMEGRKSQGLSPLFSDEDLQRMHVIATRLQDATHHGTIELCETSNELSRCLRSCRVMDPSAIREAPSSVDEVIAGFDAILVRVELMFELTGFSFLHTVLLAVRQAKNTCEEITGLSCR